jgi:uncharacterized protein
MRKRMLNLKALSRMLAYALAFASGLPLLMYLFQEHLLFHPQPLDAKSAAKLKRDPHIHKIQVTALDGVTLHGWRRASELEKDNMLIYFGGNAEETSWILDHADSFAPWSIVAMNYRGYGESEGDPSQDNLFADAITLFDHLQQHYHPNKIAVLGRSLGTGVATYLAAHRKLAGVALISPYDSITSVASDIYPFVPVEYLIKHPFNSIDLAPEISTPMVSFVGGRDKLVREYRSQRLFRAWRGEKRWLLYPTADHNNIIDEPRLWNTLSNFLHGVAAQR